MKLQLEALLFSSGRAMPEEQLAELVDASPKDVRKTLEQLREEYAARETALKVFNEGSSWKMLVRDEFVTLVRRIVADTELGRATLETLAVIAYNQPKVLQSKVIEIRGQSAYEHIKELLDLGFIMKTPKGRSYEIKLTEKFFEYFDTEESNLADVLANARQPDPQQKLGQLEVIDVPKEKTLDTYEPARLERDHKEEEQFLTDIEEKINHMSAKDIEIPKSENANTEQHDAGSEDDSSKE